MGTNVTKLRVAYENFRPTLVRALFNQLWQKFGAPDIFTIEF